MTLTAPDTAAYDRIAAAIRFLAERWQDQPSLEDAAAAVGLSPFHFQRLFADLAGISPKRFLQALTARDALRRLAEGASVLDAALDVGLSGPSRLHDLVLAVEAMTPGAWKSGGAGLTLRWGVHPTSFGPVLAAATGQGICHLAFLDGGAEAGLADLAARFPAALRVEDPEATRDAAARLQGLTPERPLRLHLKGTNFQLQVWRALLGIPEGHGTSYAALAARVGHPTAARAVAGAVAANPVAWLIPCHRVLRGTGAIGGYAWGEPRKRALLAWEAARTGT